MCTARCTRKFQSKLLIATNRAFVPTCVHEIPQEIAYCYKPWFCHPRVYEPGVPGTRLPMDTKHSLINSIKQLAYEQMYNIYKMMNYRCCCLTAQLLSYLMHCLFDNYCLFRFFSCSLSLAYLECSFIFIRSQALPPVPKRSVDLIITEHLDCDSSTSSRFSLPLGICILYHRGSWFFAFVLPFRPFALTCLFTDGQRLCSVLHLSLRDLFLRPGLFSSSPFALRLVSSPSSVQL